MQLIINGECKELHVTTVYDIIDHYDLLNKPIVTEVDGTIVSRDLWKETEVRPGMAVELVHFVGGG